MFAGETDCTYYFDWQTAYACVKETEDLLCMVTDNKTMHYKHYDLSTLTRYPGKMESWIISICRELEYCVQLPSQLTISMYQCK